MGNNLQKENLGNYCHSFANSFNLTQLIILIYFILYHRKYYSYADSDLDSSDKRSMVFHNLYKEGECYGKLDNVSINLVSLYNYVQITTSL